MNFVALILSCTIRALNIIGQFIDHSMVNTKVLAMRVNSFVYMLRLTRKLRQSYDL